MAVTDFFAGEIATELLKLLFQISLKSVRYRTTADQLTSTINELLLTIKEIKYSGVEMPAERQFHIDNLSETMNRGLDLARRIKKSGRWNVYRTLQLLRKMEKVEKDISRFLKGPLQTYILADIHHLRDDTSVGQVRLEKRFDRMEVLIEEKFESLNIGGGGLFQGQMRRAEEQMEIEDNIEKIGFGLELGKRKVKEMLLTARGDAGGIFAITGIGGSGKTTLATELCKDEEIRSYFKDKILFLTVSQSPNIGQLRRKIWAFLTGCQETGHINVPDQNFQFATPMGTPALLVLDDIWADSALEQLMFKAPGYSTLITSRSKFPKLINTTYEVELLPHDIAMSLFCLSAFGRDSIPPASNEILIKQIVNECKGLPLALKVIGASLKGQSEKYWESARKRLLRSESISESHEIKLLERMAISVESLKPKYKECFMDLGSFPEDKKIPLDVLINMWVEIRDIDEEEAFAILVDLSNKNLLTLVKDPRAGDQYTGYYDIFVTQHDVLRDLALHLSSGGRINERKRLIMAKRDTGLPQEWARNADQPFQAQIVSVHTGEMQDMDWFRMELPKAEVLILNFASTEYVLPPFIEDMPRLRALIVINHSTSHATLNNFSVISNFSNLRSLWLERISVPQLSNSTIPLTDLRKMSLILCKINNSFDQSAVDMPQIFPRLSDLTIDHCSDLFELPSSICRMPLLACLSITNCHSLLALPTDIGNLHSSLQILRLHACPTLKTLPPGLCKLVLLKYLDLSQCVNLKSLPDEIGKLVNLEKIDMRECSNIWSLPLSAASLQSLRRVICDEDVSWVWKDAEKALPSLHVQVAENCFSLEWLDE